MFRRSIYTFTNNTVYNENLTHIKSNRKSEDTLPEPCIFNYNSMEYIDVNLLYCIVCMLLS
jgi:hypothetical protein